MRSARIELAYVAWEATILPLNHDRITSNGIAVGLILPLNPGTKIAYLVRDARIKLASDPWEEPIIPLN